MKNSFFEYEYGYDEFEHGECSRTMDCISWSMDAQIKKLNRIYIIELTICVLCTLDLLKALTKRYIMISSIFVFI